MVLQYWHSVDRHGYQHKEQRPRSRADMQSNTGIVTDSIGNAETVKYMTIGKSDISGSAISDCLPQTEHISCPGCIPTNNPANLSATSPIKYRSLLSRVVSFAKSLRYHLDNCSASNGPRTNQLSRTTNSQCPIPTPILNLLLHIGQKSVIAFRSLQTRTAIRLAVCPENMPMF